MGIREETEFKLRKLQITQERLEREILGIANYDCLSVENARQKIDEMEKAGKKTVVFCGIKCLAFRDSDGNEQPFIPLWYPLYAAIGDFFNPPVDEPLFEAMKEARWQNLRRWLCTQGNENDNGYARARAAIDTVNKDLEQYRQNGRDIEDLERLLEETETASRPAITARQEAPADAEARREEPPDVIIELGKKGWLVREPADNGKFDIREAIKKDFIERCANEGLFHNKRLTLEIIDRWINHGYSAAGKSSSLYKAINKAKKKHSERLAEQRKELETQSRVADKLIEAAEKTERATKNRFNLLKKSRNLDG
jgi:hypothetical protein